MAEIFCDGSAEDATVSWPTAKAGTTAQGTCKSGYTGSATRYCTWKGVWLAPAGDECIRTLCPPTASLPRGSLP